MTDTPSLPSLVGIQLSAFTETLCKVQVHLNHAPIKSFNALERIGPHAWTYLEQRYESVDLHEYAHCLPLHVLKQLTFDEKAKLYHSAQFMIESDIEKELDQHPSHLLLKKIRSSMWRWGTRRAPWNEMVDAYNGIRSFNLGVPGLTVTLDHTTWVNERGYAAHSRTFLDGVFGYLVHYRGEHVMTIGFSISSGRKLLLQQVQLKNRRGNRWLFQMPRNRLEYIVDRFREAFPQHLIHVVDGASLTQVSRKAYQAGLSRAGEQVARYRDCLRRKIGDPEDVRRYLDESLAEYAALQEKIEHIVGELPRLSAFYQSVGRYQLGKRLSVNSVDHYRLAA